MSVVIIISSFNKVSKGNLCWSFTFLHLFLGTMYKTQQSHSFSQVWELYRHKQLQTNKNTPSYVQSVCPKYVAEHLLSHFQTSPKTLHPLHFGFRKHHSTETASFFKHVKTQLDRGGAVGAVFFDLVKAFSRANHHILLVKLSHSFLFSCFHVNTKKIVCMFSENSKLVFPFGFHAGRLHLANLRFLRNNLFY